MAATPRINKDKRLFKFERILGEPPNPAHPISGCKFHPRCRYAKPICSKEKPQLVSIKTKHLVACLRINEILASED